MDVIAIPFVRQLVTGPSGQRGAPALPRARRCWSVESEVQVRVTGDPGAVRLAPVAHLRCSIDEAATQLELRYLPFEQCLRDIGMVDLESRCECPRIFGGLGSSGCWVGTGDERCISDKRDPPEGHPPNLDADDRMDVGVRSPEDDLGCCWCEHV